MSDPNMPPADSLALAREVDRLCDEYEEALGRGAAPALGDRLPTGEPLRGAALVELVRVELEHRLRSGEAARAEEYFARYPELAADPAKAFQVVAAEYRARRRGEPGLDPEAYLGRFPRLAGHPGWSTVDQARTPSGPSTTPSSTPTTPEDAGAAAEPPGAGWAGPGSRYRPVRFHARGGLGEVYVADDEELRRQVALKRLRPSRAGPADSRRFLREAEITGGLEHPGVVPVYGLLRGADGQLSYAMRFIKGQTLQEAIRRLHDAGPAGADVGGAGLLLRQLLNRFVAVCNTMAYAHSRGVIHRDLKPANILLGEYGETLVIDWGLAKQLAAPDGGGPDAPAAGPGAAPPDEEATAAGAVLGTPAYMSPEQAGGRGHEVGPASDIYSLGATLYALLTNRPPCAGDRLHEVLRRAEAGDFPPPRQVNPATPRALEAVCLKAMAREPGRRYATALELAEDVERWLADEPVRACREPLGVRARRWVRRHRTLATAIAVLLATTLIAGGFAAAYAGRKQAEAAAFGHIEALRNAAPPEVQFRLKDVNLSDAGVMPRLRELWERDDLPESQRRRVGLALLPADSGEVRNRLLAMTRETDDPEELLLLRDHLAPYAAAEQRADLWTEARQPATEVGRRFRLLVALAGFDPDSANWPGVAEPLVEQLLASNPLQRGAWVTALQPARAALLPLLGKAARQARATEKGLLAAAILADYAADQPPVLVEALLEASPEQYAALWQKLSAYPDAALAAMEEELRRAPAAGAPDADLDALASRQANAAVTLVRLGRAPAVWPLLRSGPAPRLRSYLIHRFAALQAEPEGLLQQLWAEQDTSVRQALLLSLGEYAADQLPAGRRQELRAKLLAVHREDPDSGIHSAAEWLLRRLGGEEEVLAAEKQLVSTGPVQGRRWYTNAQGQTMVVIPGPVTFPMRANLEDPEVLKTEHIPYSFAVASKEVTLEQFRRFLLANRDIAKEYKYSPRVSPDEKGPATSVTWIHAARYCRWLSALEGIPEKEWCFPKDIKDGDELPGDYVRRKGYRLPTAAEWECACRAGTVTRRAYGSADELMKYYGWHLDNGGKRTWPVGLLKPNDWGLFDMYGNVEEWCSDEQRFPDSPEVQERLLRGSHLFDQPEDARTAKPDIYSNRPKYIGNECGMRLARTLPEPGPSR
jgi:formylglycine-generating enzyme required for sulfatase activity